MDMELNARIAQAIDTLIAGGMTKDAAIKQVQAERLQELGPKAYAKEMEELRAFAKTLPPKPKFKLGSYRKY